MPRTPSVTLTDAELRVMSVLWEKGRATVTEVVDAIRRPRKPAYTTVLTILRILEQKGYVAHESAGRAYVYSPLISEQEARGSALSHLLKRFFHDSPELLVLNLIQDRALEADELDRVRELIDRSGEAGRRR